MTQTPHRLLGDLRPSAKVTIPTRRWLASIGSISGGGAQPSLRHAQSVLMDDREVVVAYCNIILPITVDRADLPLCPRCIASLTFHGLWPLLDC